MGETATLTRDDVRTETRAAQLVQLVDCERPLAAGARRLLDGLDLVTIGRGEPAAVRTIRRGELALRVPDRALSADHARIVRLRGRWIVSDAGSKNGTLVNGAPVQRRVLLDGDVVEFGHTFFLFRDAVAPVVPEAPDLEANALTEPLPGVRSFSARLAEPLDALARVAASTVPVVIVGESGTGKEVTARALHALSRRSGHFIGVNCAAIPPGLVESTLFGHRRGAFSDALQDSTGLLRASDRGTLLLDEIGDLAPAAQAALLRALQEREVVAVGEARPVKVDLRLVVACQQPLDELVAAGRFRNDLFARLAGVIVRLPPVRERREDLGLLLATLLERAGGRGRTLTAAAARALVCHGWPRNVRELEQALTTAVALATTQTIALDNLPAALSHRPAQPPAAPSHRLDPVPAAAAALVLDSADRELRERLVALFAAHDGNVVAVAEAMGKQRAQVYKWVKRLVIDLATFRRAT